MTDTQTTREAFESIVRENFGCDEYTFSRAPDGYYSTVHSDTFQGRRQPEYAPVSMLWTVFQAAWTRKPAAQVAGAVEGWHFARKMHGPIEYIEVRSPDGISASVAKHEGWPRGLIYRMAEAMLSHPAPEPDATKVVSVPVPWRERVGHYDIKYMTNKAKAAIEAEIAEWRALAADRERT